MMHIDKLPAHAGGVDIMINDTACHLDPRGVLYLPKQRVLVVSDLHLEKGSSFARRGMMLPPYDTLVTLKLMSEIVAFYRPQCVISLGDSFHDPHAYERLPVPARTQLANLINARQWIWISGNHDPQMPTGLGGEGMVELTVGGLILRHEPVSGSAAGEVAGHLHPGARVVQQGRSLRRPCFVSDGTRLIMPAFGTYTGSLNILDKAFDGLFRHTQRQVWLRGDQRLYAVHHQFLRAD